MTSTTDRDTAEVTAEPARTLDLGQALGTVLRAYTAGARDVADGVPGGPRGYQILAVAAEGTCHNQAGIATVLGIDRTVMTSLVDGLAQADLIERRPDPADRRARQLHLTEQGRRVLGSVAARVEEIERELLSPLTTAEADELRRLLARVAGTPRERVDLCTEVEC